ncbi:hypothetical protein AGMMS50239_34860 [Bacteroidia bacterium]|nr:hypothetical protein AGMMS50239_34860 [Bacteroidia bacterium]
MATILLDYDARNIQAKKALNNILSSGFFKAKSGNFYKQETLLDKRKKLDKELDKYLFNLSDFKFSREEVNDYE